jgi:hypothetical protein
VVEEYGNMLTVDSVSAHLCSSEKVAQTRWFTKNGGLFLTILETRESRSRCWQSWCLVRAASWVTAIFCASSHGRRETLGLFYKGASPTGEGITPKTYSPPNVPIS